MRIEGEYRLASGREEVWKALLDPQALADTIPGCRRLETTGPDEYAMTVDVGVGAIKGAYRGTFRITDRQDRESCKLSARGRGAPGSVSVEADARLSDADGGGTVISYSADAKVSGALAGVGQRMISAAAKRTTTEFMSSLDDALRRGERPRPEEPEAAQSAAEPVGTAHVYTRTGQAEPGNRQFVMGLATGFAIAIAGVLVGRFTARL